MPLSGDDGSHDSVLGIHSYLNPADSELQRDDCARTDDFERDLQLISLLSGLSDRQAGCGATEYSREFENDLSQPVVVEGCIGCGSGRQVGVGDSVSLKVEQDVIVRVTTVDGTVVGCAYEPAGGSTSEPVAVRASDYQGLSCNTAPGEER